MLPGRAGQAATTTSPSPSLSSISAAHATTLEDALHDCFESLGRYDYQSSHRVIRVNAQVFHQAHHFPQLSSVLSRITSCESLYSSYAYMKQKWFKKDSLGMVYSSVLEDIQRMMSSNAAALSTSLSSSDTRFVIELLDQVSTFIGTRQRLINIYRSMSNTQATFDVPATIDLLSTLLDDHKRSFFHPYLTLLRHQFLYETSILLYLLRTQQFLTTYAYKDTMVCLYRVKSDLDLWRAKCGLVDNSKKPHRFSTSSFVTSSSSASLAFDPSSTASSPSTASITSVAVAGGIPNHYLWLYDFYCSLLAKATLYFYAIVMNDSVVATGAEGGKLQAAKLEGEFVSALKQFQKKSDAHAVSLIYEVSSAEWEPFSPSGYVTPGMPYRPPTGLNSFPAIFSIPSAVFPIDHLPNVISIIMDNRDDLTMSREQPIVFFDKRISVLYLISMVDPRVFLVAVFTERKSSSKETSLVATMSNITARIRNTLILDQLNKFQ